MTRWVRALFLVGVFAGLSRSGYRQTTLDVHVRQCSRGDHLLSVDPDGRVLVSATAVTLRRVPTPGAPALLDATVQGSSVTLTSTEGLPVAQTLRAVLEVGSAPGISPVSARRRTK